MLRDEFTVTDAMGEVKHARAIITPSLPDADTNEIYVEEQGTWKKLVPVPYRRER